jgi:hypothetical protein
VQSNPSPKFLNILLLLSLTKVISIKGRHRSGGMSQVVECLHRKQDALSTNPNTTKKEKKKKEKRQPLISIISVTLKLNVIIMPIKFIRLLKLRTLQWQLYD